MPHQVTVTGKTGPDRTVTAAVITNVKSVDFQLDAKRLFVETEVGVGDNIKEFDLTFTTATFTITGGNYAIVLS
jgi:phage baseplate assembly protein gpV